MNWKLEVGDVACPVGDMKTMDVFTLGSECEEMPVQLGEGGRTRVQGTN